MASAGQSRFPADLIQVVTHLSSSVAVQIRSRSSATLSKRKMLRNDEEARTTLRLHERAKVTRHGRLVMRHKDATIACGTSEDF